MISNISLHPDIYHLYLDLNMAFSSDFTKPSGKSYTATTSPNTLFLSFKTYTLIPLTIPPSTASLSLPP